MPSIRKSKWLGTAKTLKYLNINIKELNELVKQGKITYRSTGGAPYLKTDVAAVEIMMKYRKNKNE